MEGAGQTQKREVLHWGCHVLTLTFDPKLLRAIHLKNIRSFERHLGVHGAKPLLFSLLIVEIKIINVLSFLLIGFSE